MSGGLQQNLHGLFHSRVLLIAALLLQCNLRPPHVLLTVEDPTGAAVDLQTLWVGTGPDALKPVTLRSRSFPLRVTVVGNKAGEQVLWIEARDAIGKTLARSHPTVRLRKRGTVTTEVSLIPTCATDAECDDNLFCTGAEHCNSSEGLCASGNPPCGTAFPCVIADCVETGGGGGRCGIRVDHGRCEDPATYCNPTRGCVPGLPCDTPADCQDDSTCNGAEVCLDPRGRPCAAEADCVGVRCGPGGPPDINDHDPCTYDGCNDELGDQAIFHIADPKLDGSRCGLTDTGAQLICVSNVGGCAESRCGDGFHDQLTEQCDDGNTSNRDACVRVPRADGSFSCELPRCGDNHVWDGVEACDDGNEEDGDGCRSDCGKVEQCGDGVLDKGEPCDDGDDNPNDGCDACSLTGWVPRVIAGERLAAGNAQQKQIIRLTRVAVDASGTIFVADPVSSQIWRIETAAGLISLVAGADRLGLVDAGRASVASSANAALLGKPVALAADRLGNIYVAERDFARIVRVTPRGVLETVVGVAGVLSSLDEPLPASTPAVRTVIDRPNGVAVDGWGNVYFTEWDAARIRRVDAETGLVTTVVSSGLATPWDLVTDANGDLIVADIERAEVLHVDVQSGTLSRIAGGGSSFEDGVRGIDASLGVPIGLALAEGRRLYIADFLDCRVRMLDLDTDMLTTVAGNGAPGSPVIGGDALSNPIVPVDVEVEPAGTVLVLSDLAGLLARVDDSGRLELVAGQEDLFDAGTTSVYLRLQVTRPGATALAPLGKGYLPISQTDTDTALRLENSGITLHEADDAAADSSHEEDGAMASETYLNAPRGAAMDIHGNIYVADREADRVYLLELICNYDPAACVDLDAMDEGHRNRILRQHRFHTFVGCDRTDPQCRCDPRFVAECPRQQTPLMQPSGVALDLSTDTLYIADTGRHRLLRVIGDRVSVAAGTGEPGRVDGEASQAQLHQPMSILFQPEIVLAGGLLSFTNAVLFADRGSHSVRVFAEVAVIPGQDPGPRVQTLAGTGERGYGVSVLEYPRGVAPVIDPTTGERSPLLVVDGFDRVRRVVLEGQPPFPMQTLWGGASPMADGPLQTARFGSPEHLARFDDPDGVNAQAWLVVDRAAGTLRLLTRGSDGSVTTVAGYPDGHLQEGGEAAYARLLTQGSGVAVQVHADSSTRTVYVSEAAEGRIVRISTGPPLPAGWRVYTFMADGQLFFPGASPMAAPQLVSPQGLLFDPCTVAANSCGTACTPSLYIADAGNHVIYAVRFKATGPEVERVAGSAGQRGFFGDGGLASIALLNRPEAVTAGLDGDLYVADTGNNRVRRLDCHGTINTVIGTGEAISSGVGAPARLMPVDGPRGLAVDSHGNLFVTSRDAIRVVAAEPTATEGGGSVDAATGDSAVATIYGRSPRTDYPEAVTRCISGLGTEGDDTLLMLDSCTGFVVELRRQLTDTYVAPP